MIPKDPAILLSFINTQLRDNYKNIDELCSALSVNKKEITKKLISLGYEYNIKENQFK